MPGGGRVRDEGYALSKESCAKTFGERCYLTCRCLLLPPVDWIGLDLSCAPEIRQNQKNPASSKLDPDFLVIGYGAKAPLRLASQPHFWSGAARKFGKERTRGWGRSAQQAEDCEAIPKKSDRWLIEFTRIRQLSAFSLAQTALCSPP